MRTDAKLSFPSFDKLAARGGNLVPVWREVLGDVETPVSAFMKLPAPEMAFLLESVHGGERWGRYSYLGDRPLAHVTLGDRRLVLQRGDARTEVEVDGPNPLPALRKVLAEHHLTRTADMPPFIGGLVGYLGYGAVRWFEPRVAQRHGADPKFPDSEWMLARRVVVFDNLTHRLRLYACADMREHRSSRSAYDAAMASLDELADSLAKPLAPRDGRYSMSPLVSAWERADFERAVSRAREYIAAGDCMQVVLSRRLTAEFEGDAFDLYRALRYVSPSPFLFHLRFGERALIGASPELLVKVEAEKVTVRPIAGTRPRGKSDAEDAAYAAELKADPKERAEHVMLVDLGRNDVGRVSAPASVRVDEREVIERYSHVMHLTSQVSGKLRSGLDAFDVLAATFPAGTVSGAPKVRAMQIIDELEPQSRGTYAGAAGYITFDGNMDLAIAIRSISLAGKELRLQSGAGIVHDSDPALEYDETTHKLRAAMVAITPSGEPVGERTPADEVVADLARISHRPPPLAPAGDDGAEKKRGDA